MFVGTGVVDQKADLEIFGGRDEFTIGVRPAEVEGHGAGLDARVVTDPVGECGERLGAARHEHDVHAVRGDLAREGRTGSLGGPGDDRPRSVTVEEVGHGSHPATDT